MTTWLDAARARPEMGLDEVIAEALLAADSVSVAIDAQRDILRAAGCAMILTREQEVRLYEDAVVAVLEALSVEVPA